LITTIGCEFTTKFSIRLGAAVGTRGEQIPRIFHGWKLQFLQRSADTCGDKHVCDAESPLPARGGSTTTYGTSIGRSDSDINIIQNQLSEMLSPRGGAQHYYVNGRLDCSGLFREFGTTWGR
jgi:hypothetical protein